MIMMCQIQKIIMSMERKISVQVIILKQINMAHAMKVIQQNICLCEPDMFTHCAMHVINLINTDISE